MPGLEEYWDKDIFVTEALTQEAIKAMGGAIDKSEPFFLYMSHYAVHVPLQADARFVDKYLQQGLSHSEAAYASMIEGMDKSLGDLMDFLQQRGQLESTIIIFMSDNGGYSLWGRTPPMHSHNHPLRSGKGSAYEGGIREPMIVYWNGVATPGSSIDSYLIIEDFFPSILEMAQIEMYDTVQSIDGVSFVPMLKGDANDSSSRQLIWNMPNNWVSGDFSDYGIGATATIRQGDYKLIYWYEDGCKELYNIRTDIGETENLATAMPRLTEQLSNQLAEALRQMDAQRPTITATGQSCPWPDSHQ